MIRNTDISATIKDTILNTYSVKVRYVFRVNVDPTSPSARNQAQWMAAIDLVDPNTAAAPNISPGPATITLHSAKFKTDHIIKTEILSGTGQLEKFITLNDPGNAQLDKLSYAVPAKQALVKINGTLPPGVKLAGAQYRFLISDVDVPNIFDPVNGDEAALPAKLSTPKQVYFEYDKLKLSDPQGTDIMVVMTSSTGLDQADLSAFNYVMMSEQAAIFNDPDYWQDKLSSAVYYDTNGEQIQCLTPAIGLME